MTTTSERVDAVSTGDSTSTAAEEWAAWHAEREQGLTGEHGWLTLTALRFLSGTPQSIPGLAGEWWADADGAHVRATAPEGLRAWDTRTGRDTDEVALDGQHTVVVPEAGSTLAALGADGVAAEVALRTGRYVVRVRDPKAPARTGFTGVPTYAYDPSWVLDAPVRWYDEPRPTLVRAAQPGLRHHVRVVGELDVVRDGVTTTLAITGQQAGTGSVLFSDTTQDTAEWRVVSLPPVDLPSAAEASAAEPSAAEAGSVDAPASGSLPTTVRLDLNRALNFPAAFSDHGTCPRPVDGNHLPVPVTAGEKDPR